MKMFSKTILFIIITLSITGTSEVINNLGAAQDSSVGKSTINYVDIPSSQFNDPKIKRAFVAIRAVVENFDQRLIKKAQAYTH